MEERKGTYKVLVGKPERRRPLGRLMRKWQNTIKINLRKVRWGDMDWTDLAQNRNGWQAFVNAVINIRFP
jgi:hypothetical protein